jgi:hypothetical protein
VLLMADGVDDGTRTHDNRNHNPGLYQLSYVHHREIYNRIGTIGAPGRTRTCDPRLRRPMLYPAELRAQGTKTSPTHLSWSERWDSNLRPSGPKPDALPDCATPRGYPFLMPLAKFSKAFIAIHGQCAQERQVAPLPAVGASINSLSGLACCIL